MLSSQVHRETNKLIGKRPIIITLAPGTEKRDDLIAVRLKGQRTQHVTTVSDLYRVAALWHANKERTARAMARRNGIPWRTAKKQFMADNSIPTQPKRRKAEVPS